LCQFWSFSARSLRCAAAAAIAPHRPFRVGGCHCRECFSPAEINWLRPAARNSNRHDRAFAVCLPVTEVGHEGGAIICPAMTSKSFFSVGRLTANIRSLSMALTLRNGRHDGSHPPALVVEGALAPLRITCGSRTWDPRQRIRPPQSAMIRGTSAIALRPDTYLCPRIGDISFPAVIHLLATPSSVLLLTSPKASRRVSATTVNHASWVAFAAFPRRALTAHPQVPTPY